MINVKIKSENGLHARPASQIVAKANEFSAEVDIILDGNRANAKSIMNLLGLGIKFDDEVSVEASGEEANVAEEAIAQILGDSHA